MLSDEETPVEFRFKLSAHQMRTTPDSPEGRMWARLKQTESGCWEWQGSTTQGYAQVTVAGKTKRVHRWTYELLVGPIPEDKVIDHLCRNRACANPDHLEPVANRVNVLRGVGETAKNALKTHCIHGHAFTPENTYTPPSGGRECRACRLAASRRRPWRYQGKGPTPAVPNPRAARGEGEPT